MPNFPAEARRARHSRCACHVARQQDRSLTGRVKRTSRRSQDLFKILIKRGVVGQYAAASDIEFDGGKHSLSGC
jgi:hypothetical protein